MLTVNDDKSNSSPTGELPDFKEEKRAPKKDSSEVKLPKPFSKKENTPEKKDSPGKTSPQRAKVAPKSTVIEKKSLKTKLLAKPSISFNERSGSAKAVFIICMCLLAPSALLLGLAVSILFIALFGGCLLFAGIMAILLFVTVLAGVTLALVGVTYGIISLLTTSGFHAIAGQYELGLGIAISGITVIVSALLYSGITGLAPFLFVKVWKLCKFVFKKCKELILFVYKRCTQL